MLDLVSKTLQTVAVVVMAIAQLIVIWKTRSAANS